MSWRMMSGVRGLSMNHGLTAEMITWSRRYSTIFISRLSSYTTEEGLRNVFSPFGSIKEVRLIKDHKTGRPKGFGFVEYDNEDGAQRAIKSMNYKYLCNACGIRYKKERRDFLGLNDGAEKIKKETKKKLRNGDKMDMLGLLGFDAGVLLKQRSMLWLKRRHLGEEEEAAVLLMALSSGFL